MCGTSPRTCTNQNECTPGDSLYQEILRRMDRLRKLNAKGRVRIGGVLRRSGKNLSIQERRTGAARTKKPSTKYGRPCCGAEGDRTPDLVNAIHALSQLSYSPALLTGARQIYPPATPKSTSGSGLNLRDAFSMLNNLTVPSLAESGNERHRKSVQSPL